MYQCWVVIWNKEKYLPLSYLISCFAYYHYSVVSSKSLKVAFFNIEGEVTQCNKCIYPLSTTIAKYQKQKNSSNLLLQSLHFSFCIMMEEPNAFIKMNFDKLGCMILVELFHNSPIGPLSIPRIIERATPNSSQANGKNKNQILNVHKLPSAHKAPSPSMHNTGVEEVDELAKTIRQITNTTNVYAFDVSLLDYRTQSYWQLQ